MWKQEALYFAITNVRFSAYNATGIRKEQVLFFLKPVLIFCNYCVKTDCIIIPSSLVKAGNLAHILDLKMFVFGSSPPDFLFYQVKGNISHNA